MTLFAGIYSLDLNKKINPEMVERFRLNIARTKGKTNVYSDDRFALVKWDCEVFGEPGILEHERGITAITGEPYWEGTPTEKYSRYFDLEKISEYLGKADVGFLKECHGSYSVCHYNKKSGQLILATDKLGVRATYYIVHQDTLFFASALRILESIDDIPKRFNLTAFLEKRVFGVPLGTKTKYCDIKVLRDGEYISCNGTEMNVAFYFRWRDIVHSDKDIESIKQECFQLFVNAVSIRSSRDSSAVAFLSGGLDSRAVVSLLNYLGKKVIAFNFFVPGEQDALYANRYAKKVEIEYHSESRSFTDNNILKLMGKKLDSSDVDTLKKIKYPRCIMAGDGGSVGMGHVYLNDNLLNEYRNEGRENAVNDFLKTRKFPDKIFRKKYKSITNRFSKESLFRELNELTGLPPGRDFYLFLLRNDQRRHLHGSYEYIDITRLELVEPFYDARLLQFVASAPIDVFIGHRFYYDWLDLFPPDAKSTPWQAYPGHLPCPIKLHDEATSQWDNYYKFKKIREGEDYIKLKRVIFRKNFPFYLINRWVIYAALLAYKLKLKDVGYMFNIAYDLYSEHGNCSSTVNKDFYSAGE